MTIPIVHPFPCRKYSATRYPDGDISTGSWSPTPIWTEVDDVSDSDLVTTPIASTTPTVYTFEVSVDSPAQTPGHPMCQGLTFLARCRKRLDVGTGTVNVTVTLRQGSTTIASVTSSGIGTSFADISTALSAAQLLSITDHTDLRVRVAATISADDGLYEVYAECSQVRVVYT